ncbi:hypothetical protein MTO96_036877 [Rhipicephalus appendiculatus]
MISGSPRALFPQCPQNFPCDDARVPCSCLHQLGPELHATWRLPHPRPCSPVLKDTSCAASCPRYSCFVLPAVLVTTTTLLTTPALLLTRLDPWKRDQFTLDEDLQRSRNHSVHPCDDFYQ